MAAVAAAAMAVALSPHAARARRVATRQVARPAGKTPPEAHGEAPKAPRTKAPAPPSPEGSFAASDAEAKATRTAEAVRKAKEAAASLKPRFNPMTEIGVTEPFGFFDPIGICPKDEIVFKEYRACELKHGRVAMMASLGAVTQHFIRLPGFDRTNFGEPMPAGLGAVFNTPGSFGFVVLIAACAALELFFWNEDFDKREPGNYGDPLGLGQYDREMRNRELNNGRFAMFAAIGIISAEIATGKDAVQQLGLGL